MTPAATLKALRLRAKLTQQQLADKAGSVVVLALMFVASASAAGPSVAWTTKDMKAAIRGVGYPKPGARTLACKGLGAATGSGFVSFRCVAAYRHHRVRRFYAGGMGSGGWLCAGRTLSGCTLLKHGFATGSVVARYGLGGAGELAARGYVDNLYGAPDPIVDPTCTQGTDATQRTYCYRWTNNSVLAVTITLKPVTAGYVTSATAVAQ